MHVCCSCEVSVCASGSDYNKLSCLNPEDDVRLAGHCQLSGYCVNCRLCRCCNNGCKLQLMLECVPPVEVIEYIRSPGIQGRQVMNHKGEFLLEPVDYADLVYIIS